MGGASIGSSPITIRHGTFTGGTGLTPSLLSTECLIQATEFLDWWHREAHRILSPGPVFADTQHVEIPAEAF
ncbi:hypothetical protein AHAS_Ahas20G0178600 [Arachis hypogaea]